MLITARALVHKYLGSLALGGLFLILSIPSLAVNLEEIVKLTAEGNEVPNAFFGWSVDVEGDTAVVGAYYEDHTPDTTPQWNDRRGAAYVFTRSAEGNWSRQARLVADDAENNDRFGYRVAVSGDTIIVGAYFDDDEIDGQPTSNSGAAYVYTRSGEDWSIQAKLLASDRADGDRFGGSVALAGDVAFIAAPNDDYDIYGDANDEWDAGSVYVFTRSGVTWTEQDKLHPLDAQATHFFGGGLSLSGGSLLIAATGDADNAGAAYVFTGSGSSWAQQAKLTASDRVAWDRLGISVALSADTAILGAPYVDKAYVFDRVGVTWTQQQKLTASDDSANRDFFGIVALSGDTAVVGADAADGGCFLFDSGAAYVFTHSEGVWTERAKLGASDATEKEWFGGRVAMSGDTVLIAAPTSVIEPKDGPGSVYVFDFGIDDTGVWNALVNGSFEASDISGWFNLEAPASVGMPAAGAQDVDYAAVLTPDPPGAGASIILQNFPARPGDEFYASGYMLTEHQLVDSPASRRIIKLSFLHLDCPFDLTELEPETISKGVGGADPFPGIEGLPLLDSSSALGTWQLTQSQGVAPEGTNLASVTLLNINDTGSLAPIWFDNVVVARLVPDMDSDGIANDIDTDPLADTGEFSDGMTSGTITDPGDQTLTINDEPSPDGIRITASASGGSGDAATVSVCDGTANLTFDAGDESVVTCGSVQVIVIVGEVEVEVEVNGGTAIVNVPADNEVTYEPPTETVPATFTVPLTNTDPITVTAAADNDDSIVVIFGEDEIVMEAGDTETVPSVEIDIKPGSDPNCFNKNGHGVIPVAILGSDAFEVTDIDQSTLKFEGMLVRVKGNNRRSCGLEDTNADGFDDLVCHFEDDATSWTPGDAWATLSGEAGGTSISGTDSICIVP